MANLFRAIRPRLGLDPTPGETAAIVQSLARPLLEEYQSSPLFDHFTVGVIPSQGLYSRVFCPTRSGKQLIEDYQKQKHAEGAISLILPDRGGWVGNKPDGGARPRPSAESMLRLVAAHYQPNERERAVIIRTWLNRSIIVEITDREHLGDFFRKVHAALAPDRLVVGCVFCVQLPKSSDTCTIRVPVGLPATYAVEHSRHPGKLFGVTSLTQILGHHVDAKLSLTLWPQAPPIVAPVATHHTGAWLLP
jgi:hypothetical protein